MIGTHCDCKPKNTELVQEVKENMPAFDEIMNLSDFFKVMGDSTRLSKLIKSRKEGKTVYYSLDDEHIETILGLAFDHTKEH